MKRKLNLTIDKDLLDEIKVYARHTQSSVSQLVESYFKTLISKSKKKSIIDIIEKLPKPKTTYPHDFDFKKEYFEQNRKKYGF